MEEKKKKKVNMRELIDKYQQNCDRVSEIAELCEKENRERTKAETEEYEAIVRENQMLQMKMQAAASEHLRENPNAVEEAENLIRENLKSGRKTEFVQHRDLMMVSDIQSGALVPLKVQDILKPLQEGFILDKVGLPMPTGLSGDFVWPTYEMVEAKVAGEGASLSETKIPFGKLTASPERVGISIPVTNQSLNQSQGVLETIVREIMPLSIRLLLNKILFSTAKVNGATNLVGPFVGKVETATQLSATPTFKELNGMKAKVLESGIDGEHMCWIITKSMAAVLEGTPVNEKGIFVPMLRDGILCGLPVYTTNAIRQTATAYKKYNGSAWEDTADPESGLKGTVASESELPKSPASGDVWAIATATEYIGLGDWRYQPMGLFGSIRFIVDPYSKASEDSIRFILNADYGTKTLRPEAFALGKVAAE